VFQHQFETIAEHNCWTPRERATYLIANLQGWASNVLYGVSKGVTSEEILEAPVLGLQHAVWSLKRSDI
jgi:hypothetical protein